MSRLVLLTCLCSFLVPAQTPDTATLRGQVTDQTHGAVPQVQVTVTNTLTGLKRTAETDESGNYSIAGLPIAGTYDVVATKQGFAEMKPANVTLAGGTTAGIDLQLNATGGKTVVTVTGAVGEARTDGPQLGDRLDAEQMEDTPLLNRRITYLPLLNAANRQAINQGDVFMNEDLFTTNGAGRRQTWFEIDGANGNDSWGRQTIFSNIPLAAVQEMTILNNGFSAEYGASTGSAVNIVTKSGGEQFHGEALELWRPADTSAALSGFSAANGASGNDIVNDSLGQTALSLSGPLASNTHFFVSGENSREEKGSPVISPLDPTVFEGAYHGWLAYTRLDHQINDKNNVFYRFNADIFTDTNPNGIVGGNSLPSVDRIFHRRTYSNEIGETAALRPTLLNNVRLQFQLASPITEFDPVINGTEFSVPISTGGTFTRGTSQSALLMNRQFEMGDTLSAVWGKHQVKFGGDGLLAHTGGDSKEFGGPIYDGEFIYNTCTQSVAFCESQAFLGNIANVKSYTQSYGNASYTVDDWLWSLFVQDDWKILPNLTINLGLRYERQTFTNSNKDFAPRAGFAYNWKNTVIRGSFGIYYSQIVDNSEANYALTGPTGVFNYVATPGQIGFPTSVADAPLPAFPAGAQAPLRSLYVRPGDSAFLNQFFPTSTLIGYQNGLYSPYSEQWTFGIERQIAPKWVLAVDYVGAHTLRINRPLDVDPPSPYVRTQPNQIRSAQAANCTRPYWIYWYAQQNLTCNPNTATNPQPPYAVIQSDSNDGYSFYDALDVNLTHRFGNHLAMLASYTWSHAIDNVDPDTTSQNPNDSNFTGHIENGNAIFDQRQRFVLSGVYNLPFKINFGGVMTLASGLPYNVVTGTNNSGDTGATTDRPVINGVVIGRDTGHGTPIYDVSPFVERPFNFGERLHVNLRAEAFNVLNHVNQVGFSGTYGNGSTPAAGFGAPLVGVTNQLPARSLQFSVRVAF
jgi:hypothetical protein